MTIHEFLKEQPEFKQFKHIKYVKAPGPKSAKQSGDIEYLEVLGKKYALNVPPEDLIKKLKHMEDQFGNRARAAVDNIDYKSLSHAVRVVLEVTELLQNNFIRFPLIYAETIKQIKAGKISLEVCMGTIETHVAMADQMMASDSCPVAATADQEFLDKFILEQLG